MCLRSAFLSSSPTEPPDTGESAAIHEDSSDTFPPPGLSDDSSADDAQDAVDKSSRKTERPKKPTRKIHRRLQLSRRRRASDNPILELPRHQYQQIVELTARQFIEPRSQPPPELETVLRQWGVEPSQWCAVVEHFGELFHRAVGRVENLSPTLARVGRKWIQSIQSCRDVFT